MNQTQALEILKTGANVFLTGEPGSGKTYTVNQYTSYLRDHGIQPAITASTGIAATHIGGVTIHSWSGIGIKNNLSKSDLRNLAANDYIEKRVGKANVLIIDEISMLPPTTLQMVDAVCREVKKNSLPFGGIQVILVGDFFQLPPIVKRNFDEQPENGLFEENLSHFSYDSSVWSEAEFTTCYLTEQHRQDDMELLSLLSKIRSNKFDDESLLSVQKRRADLTKLPQYAPKLFSHNLDVDAVNEQTLAKIDGEPQLFVMETKGREALIGAMKKGCLSPEKLYLKVGASVMFTKNSPKEGFVNGTLGVVKKFDRETKLPVIKIRNGREIKVSPAEWTVEEDGKVKGLLTQIPLRLAWAITVHKSQGVSLDEAVIDLSRVFEFGQGYVAISRVKRLTGIYILGWNEMAFQVNPDVLQKDEDFRLDSVRAERVHSSLEKDKLRALHEEFIVNCGGEINIPDVLVKNKKSARSTYNETFRLWKSGKKIGQIANIRNLSEGTILCHIEYLVAKGLIARSGLSRIVGSDLRKDLPRIKTVFEKLNTDKLSPIYLYFDGKYSYDELRLARMMMERKVQIK